jgi:hypothetical protein
VGVVVGALVGKRVGTSEGAQEKVQPSSFSFKEGHMQLVSTAWVSAAGAARNPTSATLTKDH